MAETIWGQTPLSGALEAYKETSQAPAEAQLLSAKAEAARLGVAEQKEAMRTRMATRMALSRAQQMNAGQDMSSIQGNIKVLDDAIKGTDDPEVRQSLFKQKQGLQSDQAKLIIEQGKAREDERAKNMEAAGEAIQMGPDGADNLIDLGQRTGTRLYEVAGYQMKDQLPIAMFGNKKYSELSDTEQKMWRNSVLRAGEPKAGEATVKNALRESYEQQQLEEKKRNDDLQHQAAMARAAATREGIKVRATKEGAARDIAEAKLITSTSDAINKLKKEQSALLIKAGMPRTGVTTESWFSTHHKDLPAEVADAYDQYNIAIKEREVAGEKAKAALGKPADVKKMGTGTKEDPIKLD